MSNATEWRLPPWFIKIYRILVIVVLCLIALGGSTRVMNAGLACPDWPLCFGRFVPDYHPQVYFEFIHRVVAGLVSIGVVSLHVILLRNKNVSRGLKKLAAAAMLLLLSQVVMGGLTVLLQLKAGVVATHLGMGTGLFAVLVWIYQSLVWDPATAAKPQASSVKRMCLAMLGVIYLQIILGGLVASNYGANVCAGEWPTCYGSFFPTFSGTIGLHIIHRTWAYVVFLTALSLYFVVRKAGSDVRLRKLTGMMMGVVFLQVCVGIANVKFNTPPLIAVVHLLFAAKILWLAVRSVHRVVNVGVAK
jgi:cytochrome c oxidase assembly protein subunit 15